MSIYTSDWIFKKGFPFPGVIECVIPPNQQVSKHSLYYIFGESRTWWTLLMYIRRQGSRFNIKWNTWAHFYSALFIINAHYDCIMVFIYLFPHLIEWYVSKNVYHALIIFVLIWYKHAMDVTTSENIVRNRPSYCYLIIKFIFIWNLKEMCSYNYF